MYMAEDIFSKINKLEKTHIECSTKVNERMANLEAKDREVTDILKTQSRSINSLPWKIFGFIATVLGTLSTIAMLTFNTALKNIQTQYEKIIVLEIRNINNEIKRLHPEETKRIVRNP